MFELDIKSLEWFPKNILFEDLKGNLIRISYKNKIGGQPKKIEIKRHIQLDQEFFEGLGLYIGEGEKCEGTKRVSFMNGDLEILKTFINWLEKYFGLNKCNLKLNVVGSKNSEIKNLNKKWSTLLNLPISKFNQPGVPKTNPGNIERVNVKFHSIIFHKTLLDIAAIALEEMKTNREWGIGFLRGFYAAEGCPEVRRNRNHTLNGVNLCGKDLEILNLIHEILLKNGISCKPPKKCKNGRNKDGQYELDIYGYMNFIKLKELDIFKNSKSRKNIFLYCLSRFKRVEVPEWSNGQGLGEE